MILPLISWPNERIRELVARGKVVAGDIPRTHTPDQYGDDLSIVKISSQPSANNVTISIILCQ